MTCEAWDECFRHRGEESDGARASMASLEAFLRLGRETPGASWTAGSLRCEKELREYFWQQLVVALMTGRASSMGYQLIQQPDGAYALRTMFNAYVGVGQGDIHAQHQEVMAGAPGTWLFFDKFVRRPDVLPMDGAALAFRDDSLGCVYASHVLEHFSHRDTWRDLNEWYRVLRPDGRLIVNVPDFDWACRAWLNPALRTPYFREDQKFLEVFFGGQDGDGEVHFTGFTANGLKRQLLQVGFLRVDVRQFVDAHDMQVILATATK